MHRVDGIDGWKHWHDNGDRMDLENPSWQDALGQYVEMNDKNEVRLDIDAAVKLGYMHSPAHRRQLEELYLSALDVTRERFRLDTQFFGGYDSRYGHNGSLIPPALRYSPALGRFIINPAIDGAGVENNRVTLGRPFGANPALQLRRRFATAGEFLAGFANSFVFEFTGNDANLATSLANFSLFQPLLRGAGKDIALEELTFAERTLLANLRAYSQFRQGFYTQLAVGDLGVSNLRRNGFNTTLTSFSGDGNVGGYLGLLRQEQQIRNTKDTLSLQRRTLTQLEIRQRFGQIELVQVDQFRQSIEGQRSALLLRQNNIELALDRYKTNTLGLPPDLPTELNVDLIDQFQLVSRDAIDLQDNIVDLKRRVGEVPDVNDSNEDIEELLQLTSELIGPIEQLFKDVAIDLERMQAAIPERLKNLDEKQTAEFAEARETMQKTFKQFQTDFEAVRQRLEEAPEGLTADNRVEKLDDLASLLGLTLRNVEQVVLVQARARLESIAIEPIELDYESAFQIALANRLDFMNGRAALVDTWRLIQVNADALQSVLNVTASGELRTARNNPVSFRAPTGNLRIGLEFDAPFTRLLERNNYREALIQYQRDRRSFIQSRDRLNLGVRALIRQIRLLRANLEIQRGAVAIAIRQVDSTQADLSAPSPRPQPGQRVVRFNPTTAINLLSAQNSFRETQNSFLDVWLNYRAARMRLARELGTMVLDPDGRWLEFPFPTIEDEDGPPQFEEGDPADLLPVPPLPELPPALPTSLRRAVDRLQDDWITTTPQKRPNKPAVAKPIPRIADLPQVRTETVKPLPLQPFPLKQIPPLDESVPEVEPNRPTKAGPSRDEADIRDEPTVMESESQTLPNDESSPAAVATPDVSDQLAVPESNVITAEATLVREVDAEDERVDDDVQTPKTKVAPPRKPLTDTALRESAPEAARPTKSLRAARLALMAAQLRAKRLRQAKADAEATQPRDAQKAAESGAQNSETENGDNSANTQSDSRADSEEHSESTVSSESTQKELDSPPAITPPAEPQPQPE